MQKEIDSVKQVIGNTINQPILKDGIFFFFAWLWEQLLSG